MMKILLMDFDGVIHSMQSGWQGPRRIKDPPVEGMIQWINDFIGACGDDYCIHVFSSRSQFWGGRRAMRKYMERQGVRPEIMRQIRFPKGKTNAWAVIDDRAVPFDSANSLAIWARRKIDTYSYVSSKLDIPKSKLDIPKSKLDIPGGITIPKTNLSEAEIEALDLNEKDLEFVDEKLIDLAALQQSPREKGGYMIDLDIWDEIIHDKHQREHNKDK